MSITSIKNIYRQSNGFTLIELIIIIVILGIFGSMGSEFISTAFKGFQATDARMEIFEEGRIALVRIEREVINAIPNAVLVTITSGSQEELRVGLIAEDLMASGNVTGRYIESPPTTKITDDTGSLGVGVIVSIYNTRWDTFADSVASARRLYEVTAKTGNEMTLDRLIPGDSYSPRSRFYAVDKAVRYYYDSASGQLRRSEIPIDAVSTSLNDAAFVAATGYPLATNISDLEFSYTPGVPSRNAVVTISFTITKNNESIEFNKEVHLRNTP